MTKEIVTKEFVEETPMAADAAPFAGVPAWERGKTRRTTTVRTTPKSNVAPIAAGAAIVLLCGAAAAAWYGMRPHDQSVAELTPGSPGTSTTTTTTDAATAQATPAQTVPTAPPTRVAQAEQPPVATRTVTHTSRTTAGPDGSVTTSRSRSVTRSAGDNTADVSTTAPANPGSAPLVLNLPQTTPAPAPQATAPQAAPLIPPSPQAAPQTAAPPASTPPTEGTPPTA